MGFLPSYNYSSYQTNTLQVKPKIDPILKGTCAGVRRAGVQVNRFPAILPRSEISPVKYAQNLGELFYWNFNGKHEKHWNIKGITQIIMKIALIKHFLVIISCKIQGFPLILHVRWNFLPKLFPWICAYFTGGISDRVTLEARILPALQIGIPICFCPRRYCRWDTVPEKDHMAEEARSVISSASSRYHCVDAEMSFSPHAFSGLAHS